MKTLANCLLFCFWSEKINVKIQMSLCCDKFIYLVESKVLQYFGNICHNSSVPGAFALVIKVMNNPGFLDAELV